MDHEQDARGSLRLGSMCTGYGGLDLAVGALLPAAHAWHAEIDPAATAVLAAHHPEVPNLGDITNPGGSGPYGLPQRRLAAPRRARQATKRERRRRQAWQGIAGPVDVLTAGFPCQGFSMAGKRRGSRDRRHLWPTGVLPAVEAIRPPLVVLENVPGLITIEAGAVFGTVLADLDRLGYRVSWTTVGACQVGACHHRHRVFIAATLADVAAPTGDPVACRTATGWEPAQDVLFGDVKPVKWPASGMTVDGLVWPLPVQTCGARGGTVLPAPTATPYGNNQSPSRGAAVRPSLAGVVQMLPTPRVAASRTGRSAILGSSSAPSLDQALEIACGVLPRELDSWEEAPQSWRPLPTPLGRDATRGAGRTVAEGRPLSEVIALPPTPTRADGTSGPGHTGSAQGSPNLRTTITLLPTPRASDGVKGGPNQRGSSGDLALPAAVQPDRFGAYGPAVARQAVVFGLPTPDQTEPGTQGQPRLAAPFAEWLVGLAKAYLTGHVGRGDAIRLAGNGVVWQQGAYALSTLPTFRAAQAALTGEVTP